MPREGAAVEKAASELFPSGPLQMLWLLFLTLPFPGGSVPMTPGESGSPPTCSGLPEVAQGLWGLSLWEKLPLSLPEL